MTDRARIVSDQKAEDARARSGSAQPPGRTVDLNQARAARQEKGAKPITVTVGEDSFTLPPELPLDLAEGIQRLSEGEMGGFRDMVDSLFGEEQAEAFMAYRPTIDDLALIMEAYGARLGESKASGSSSESASPS